VTKTTRTALQLAEMYLLKAFAGNPQWREYILAAIEIQGIEFSYELHYTLWVKFLAGDFSDIPYEIQEPIMGDIRSVVDRAIAKIQYIYCEKRVKYWLELYRNAAIEDKPYFQTKIEQETLRKVGLAKLMESFL
jgi:DNA primase